MLLGYNTNGLAHHDLVEAIDLLAEIGYRSVAITIDHAALGRRGPLFYEQIDAVSAALARHGMRSVIETGARFLLDSHLKHEPTLVSPEPEARARRVEFYRHAIEVAQLLGSDCVSLWSGVVRDGAGEGEVWQRLEEGLKPILEWAAEDEIPIGFEPEPGMAIDTMARFDELVQRVSSPQLQLTLDIGHLHCQGETPIEDYIARYGARLVNVHLEDMRAGIHEHLMFGEGEMDFPPILQAIAATGYRGGVHVELSRHSHDGPNAARRSLEFLKPLGKWE